MPQSHCLRLPTELWIAILSHVDDLTLWTSCRRVSRLFRAKAEREFVTQRLKCLRLLRTASGQRLCFDLPVKYAFTTGLQSIEGLRATFGLNMQYSDTLANNTTQDPSLDPILEAAGRYGLAHRLLSNSDRDVGARLILGEGEVQIYGLGAYTIDVPLNNLDLELDGEKIIFDWKGLLDNLLGVYAHSQQQAELDRCTDLHEDVIEQHLLRKYAGREVVHFSER